MTTFKRGQVVLVQLPLQDADKAALRPAVVLHPGFDSDLGLTVLPLLPQDAAGPSAFVVKQGTYEAARMGIVSTLCLDPWLSVDLPRALITRVIGRCPYQMLDEILRLRRSPLNAAARLLHGEHRTSGEEPPQLAATEAPAPVTVPPATHDLPEAEAAVALPAATQAAIPAGQSPSPSMKTAGVEDRAAAEPSGFAGFFPVEPARYRCLRTPHPIAIDGDLTKPVWQAAPASSAFVDIVSGKPAWFDTRVRLLWDDDFLYFGFTAEETDVWGTLTERDSKIYEENDLEIFIAGKDAYYEFEISACNVIYEVFWIWKDAHHPGGKYWGPPEFNPSTQRIMTLDGVGGHVHPRGERWGFLDWDCPGLRHAVKVDGTLNQRDDTDRGWSAEIAIPWSSLHLLADGRSLPPKVGDVWRIDCSRFQKISEHGEELDPCAGWTWNQHGHYDSHIPEVFPYVTFSAEQVMVDPMTQARNNP